MDHKKLTAIELAARLARPKRVVTTLVAGAISVGAAHQAHADAYAGNIADLDTPQAAYEAGFALGFASAQNNSLAVWGNEPEAPYGGTFAEGVIDGGIAGTANNGNPEQGTPPGLADPEDPGDPDAPGDPGDDGDGGGCACSCGCG
jgi:hypothetical protein